MSKNLFYLGGTALIVLAAGLGVIWLLNQPGESSNHPPESVEVAPRPGSLQFTLSTHGSSQAVWDPEDPSYARRFEKNVEGHFDFPFENPSQENAELGFLVTTCDCLTLEVALIPADEWRRYDEEIQKDPKNAKPKASWVWQKLARHEKEGIVIPPGGKGLVRVAFKGRRSAGHRLTIQPTLWHQPQGRMAERGFEKLIVPAVVSEPVEFAPATQTLMVGEKAEFVFWSTTRTELNLSVEPTTANPGLQFQWNRLTKEELSALKTVKTSPIDPFALSAYRLEVMRDAQTRDKQQSGGRFQFSVPVLLDGEKLPIDPPIISGTN
jgi:hypothetical protein